MINYDFIELDSSKKSLALLGLFYESVYQPSFTDPDSTASLADMKYYLDRKTQGYGGRNDSHIILALDNNRVPVAGAIVDYIAKANSGFLEFIVVAEKNRKQGLGFALFQHIEELLKDNARHITRSGLDYILLETSDPLKDPSRESTTRLFESWGFKYLNFPYVQPALSKDKEPVYDFIILASSYKNDDFTFIPSGKIKVLFSEYFRYAMRIKPNQNKEFLEIQRYLDEKPEIEAIPVDEYLQEL